MYESLFIGTHLNIDQWQTCSTVLKSGLGLESGLESIFAGLGLGKICNQVHFQFSLCTFAVFCLGCMTFGQVISYRQPKIAATYLIFTPELTQGLACFYSCSTCTYCKGLGLILEASGLDLTWLLLDLIHICAVVVSNCYTMVTSYSMQMQTTVTTR